MEHIGTLREKSLHAALKTWYAEDGDRFEERIEGYVIDIVRGGLLIEIQTGSFAGIKEKLRKLCENNRVRLVYPIAQEKWVVRVDKKGRQISRRKSPKRGSVYEMFGELVYTPGLLAQPNFSFEALLIESETIWRDDGNGSWRRKGWSVHDQRLVKVVDRHLFSGLENYLSLIPAKLTEPFSNKQIAEEAGIRDYQARKMTYCLREAGALMIMGRQRNALLYSRTR